MSVRMRRLTILVSCIILGSFTVLCGCAKEEEVLQVAFPSSDMCKIEIKDTISDYLDKTYFSRNEFDDETKNSYINVVKMDIEDSVVDVTHNNDSNFSISMDITSFQGIVDGLVHTEEFRKDYSAAELVGNEDMLVIGYIKNLIGDGEKSNIVLPCTYDGYSVSIDLAGIESLFIWDVVFPEDEAVISKEFYTEVDGQRVLIEIDDVSDDISSFEYKPDSSFIRRVQYRAFNLGDETVVFESKFFVVSGGEVYRPSEVVPGITTATEIESCSSVSMDVLVWSENDGDIYWIDDIATQRIE